MMSRFVVALALAFCACKSQPPSCLKMQALCETKLEDCTQIRDTIQQKLGAAPLDKFDACYLGATSCQEANGCVAAAAFQGTADGAKGFLEGFAKELEKKK